MDPVLLRFAAVAVLEAFSRGARAFRSAFGRRHASRRCAGRRSPASAGLFGNSVGPTGVRRRSRAHAHRLAEHDPARADLHADSVVSCRRMQRLFRSRVAACARCLFFDDRFVRYDARVVPSDGPFRQSVQRDDSGRGGAVGLVSYDCVRAVAAFCAGRIQEKRPRVDRGLGRDAVAPGDLLVYRVGNGTVVSRARFETVGRREGGFRR